MNEKLEAGVGEKMLSVDRKILGSTMPYLEILGARYVLELRIFQI